MSRFSKVLFGSIIGVGFLAFASSAFAYSVGSAGFAKISPNNDITVNLGEPVVLTANIDQALLGVATWYELTNQSGVNINTSGNNKTATLSFSKPGAYGIILDINIFGDHDIASIVVNVRGDKPFTRIDPTTVVAGQQFRIIITSNYPNSPVDVNLSDRNSNFGGWTTGVTVTGGDGNGAWQATAATALCDGATYKYKIRIAGQESDTITYQAKNSNNPAYCTGGPLPPPPPPSGNQPPPPPPPPPSANIVVGMQGLVIRADNSSVGITTTITIVGPTNKQSYANPDWSEGALNPGSYNVTVDIPSPGYLSAEHSVCSNGVGCHSSGSWQPGATANVTVNSGYTDIWFRLKPNPEVNPPAPAGSEVCNFGACSISEAGIYSCSNNGIRLCKYQDNNGDGLGNYCYSASIACPGGSVCVGQNTDPSLMCLAGGTTPVEPPPGVPPPPPGLPPPPVGTPPPPPQNYTGNLRVGMRVQTNDNVNVRKDPGGDASGGQSANASGQLLFGPIWGQLIRTTSNYWWWWVDFDGGADGWVADDFLKPEGAPNIETVINAGPDVSGSYRAGDTLLARLNGWTNPPTGIPVVWRMKSGPDGGSVTFDPPDSPVSTARLTKPGNYVVSLCNDFINACDDANLLIRQGGTTGCSAAARDAYIAKFCPAGFDPTKVNWGGVGGISINEWGPYHACNIHNLPAGGITAGGCNGKYDWPIDAGGVQTGPSSPNPAIDRDINQKGLKLVIEAWNPNWLRGMSLNGIGTTDVNFASRWLWTRAYSEGPYKYLGIPSHQADYIPEEFLDTYLTPEELINSPGIVPGCMSTGYDPNTQLMGLDRGWWSAPAGANPDGSRPGRVVNQNPYTCIPDVRGWSGGGSPAYAIGEAGPRPYAYLGTCDFTPHPDPNADLVVGRNQCQAIDTSGPPPPPPPSGNPPLQPGQCRENGRFPSDPVGTLNFRAGDRVVSLSDRNVRQNPNISATKVGEAQRHVRGRVISDRSERNGSGDSQYLWYEISWDNGVSGWTAVSVSRSPSGTQYVALESAACNTSGGSPPPPAGNQPPPPPPSGNQPPPPPPTP
ncbi:MAG: hypothetical protein O2794_02515, partial [bacterium]|nr:hypothetical protein [bacterium]